jgi:hypothetical protein
VGRFSILELFGQAHASGSYRGSAKQTTDAAPQTATLAAAIPVAQRVGELARAVSRLRSELEAMPPELARSPEQWAQIARLLSEVALFRIALANKTDTFENKTGAA